MPLKVKLGISWVQPTGFIMNYMLASLLLISAACGNQQKEYQKSNPSLLLGFTFGMTEKQFNRHLEKLLEDGKIYVNDFDLYTYDMAFDKGKAETSFTPYFYNSKLNQLLLALSGSGNL
ncbi:MAG: hypothetical protein MI921_02815 [Cytophagales bacterium]|nr:hypothetical protein [Cytophagales bacterium]